MKIRDLVAAEVALLRPHLQNEAIVQQRVQRLEEQLVEQRQRLADHQATTLQLARYFEPSAAQVVEVGDALELHDDA